MNHEKMQSGRHSGQLSAVALATTIFLLLPTLAAAGAVPVEQAQTDHIFGIAAGSSVLSGSQSIQNGFYYNGNFIQTTSESVPNKDLFDAPYSFGLSYGVRPNGRQWILTAELDFTMINSTRVLRTWSSIDPHSSEDIYLWSLRAEVLRPLAEFDESWVLPEVGAMLEFGTGNLERISWQSGVFAAGPELAGDLKLSRSLETRRFTSLHLSLAYAQSFTEGWPSRFEMAAGIRFSWR